MTGHKMKTILITGINGYLGSRIAKRYVDKYNIIGLEYSLDDLFRLEGENFEVYASRKGIPEELFKKHDIDIIIHAATFYGRGNESDSQLIYANLYLPQLLLEEASAKGCNLLINTDTVLDPFTSSYALTKNQFADWCKFYAGQDRIKIINLRLEHFYGPGTSNNNFITLMVQKMLNNQNSIPLTLAEQNRDFLYIDDLLAVYDLMINRAETFDNFISFDIGAGTNTNLRYILEFIKTETKSVSELNFGEIPYRKNELMNSETDNSKLMKLGWRAKTSIDVGLKEIISYEKTKRDSL